MEDHLIEALRKLASANQSLVAKVSFLTKKIKELEEALGQGDRQRAGKPTDKPATKAAGKQADKPGNEPADKQASRKGASNKQAANGHQTSQQQTGIKDKKKADKPKNLQSRAKKMNIVIL